jgi:hypothetical protein
VIDLVNKDKKNLYDRIVAKENPFIFELKYEFFAFGNKRSITDKTKYIIRCNDDIVEKYIKFKKIGEELQEKYTDKYLRFKAMPDDSLMKYDNKDLEYIYKTNQLQIQYDIISNNIKNPLRNATVKLYDYIDGLENEEDVKSISEQIQLLY